MEASEGQHSLTEYGEDNKPPQLSFKLKRTGDVVTSTTEWKYVHLPIDILLLTVESCDFLRCFFLLDQPFRSYKEELGYVYFGCMGGASDEGKLRVALMTSTEGSATPGGSLAVGQVAFRVLRPKAVFSVGTCISLDSEKVRRGDVVISSKLTTAEGFKVPVSPLLGHLVKDAPYGWAPPLKNPGESEFNIHPNGDILSLSLTLKRQYDDICKEYPGAVAVETEGKGVYAAAYDTNIDWVIVKGVASYFHQNQSATSEWMSFASTMAASVVAKVLNDPTVFRKWPHYNKGVERATLDQGYSLLRSGHLEYAIGTQATIQHTGVDRGTLDQGASFMTSNRLASAMGSHTGIKENRGKRPLHPLVTTTPERERQNTDIHERGGHGTSDQCASLLTSSCLASSMDSRPRIKENHGKRPSHPLETTIPKRQRQKTDFPETNIDISKVVELLKREYNRRADLSPLLWSKGMKLQLKEVYTRLRVVSRRKAESSEIDVDDIFGSSEEDNDPLVLAEGSPGIGKTTFCLKLAHDWANGAMPRNFPSFKLVFLLKCRDMKGDVVEEIFEQLLPEDLKEKNKKALVNFLEDLDNQKQILIILDGLDELPKKSEERVNKVLGRKHLSFCYVLATTRQEKGIDARKQFKFDISLAIEGFSKENSFEYIRKHFRNIGTEHSSKGERLIEEIKHNPLLRHLQSNPLNLLLLCVVYEDHEGSLPSSSTELYQTIVRCLLKRYCAREELKASKKDEDLDKRFEINILALGELAWRCLVNDRLSFYEDELEEVERSNENIVARRLGLVYKEESLKRLKPRHAYSFLHKTFQEYLAASYIAHKFRGSEFQMLEKMLFPEIARRKFKQVFVFVCGILREEANIPFEQIGNMLQKQWDWLECDMSTACFFVDSWKETGNAERMAKTLCSFLPLPRSLHVWNPEQCDVLCVLKKCAEVSEVLTFTEVHVSLYGVGTDPATELLELLDVKSVILCAEREFTSYKSIVKYLSKTLVEKMTFALSADVCRCVSEVPDFGLSSVRLRICGSLGSSSLQDVENLLLHKCLSSLSITVCGDVQESLVEALARGLAGESAVKFLDWCVNGNFSFHGAYLLEKGILRNRSLTNVKVSVNGEPPENWQAVAKNLRAQFAEKAIVSAIYPNTFSKVKDTHVTHLNRFLSKTDSKQQTVTLNVWGELSGDGCKAVCELLLHSPVSHLTLNIHGQLTDEILRSTARCVDEQEKLSSITINAWVEMTEKENELIKELGLDKNPSFSLNVHGTSAPLKESSDSKVISSDEPASLVAFFEKATKDLSKSTEDTSQKSLTMKINNDGEMINEWEHDLCEGLAGNTSLKSLTLEIDNYVNTSEEWGRGFGEGLAQNTSLESLAMKINDDGDMSNEWQHDLGEGLAGNTSLKSLTLEVENGGDTSKEWGRRLGEGLAGNTSLKSLTLQIYTYCGTSYDWGCGLGEGLAQNTSLESLTMKVDNCGDVTNEWEHGLGEGLAGNASLKSFTLEIENYDDMSKEWGRGLGEGLAQNTSLESLTMKINNYGDVSNEWEHGLGEGLTRNISLKSLTLEIYNCGDTSKEWGRAVGEGLARNTSVESLTLQINNHGDTSNEWEHGLGEGLARNTSLKSLTMQINNRGNTSKEWGRRLCEGLTKNTSLKSLTLQIYNCGDTSMECGRSLSEGLAQNTSLESLTMKIDNCGDVSNKWEHGLGEGLAGNTSLKSLTLEIEHHGDTSKEWGCGLGEGLARNTSLESLKLKIYTYGGTSKEWGRDLGKGLAQNTSLESLTMKIYNCGDVTNEWEHGLGEGLAGNTSLKSLTLKIENYGDMSKEWGCGLGEGLARNTSLESLKLKIYTYGGTSKEWGRDLGKGLAQNTSLESLTMKIYNCGDVTNEWEHGLGEGLAGNTSLISLILEIENYGDTSKEWGRGLGEGLARNTSLKSLRLEIENYGDTSKEWGRGLGEGLARNTSLKSLRLEIENYGDTSKEWGRGLGEGLARNTSLKSLTLQIYTYGDTSKEWRRGLGEGLAQNTSLESLTMKIDNCGDVTNEWQEHGLGEGLARNTSLKSLTLEIDNCGYRSKKWGHGLGEGLAQNSSLESLTMKIENDDVSNEWEHGLGEGLAGNISLKSLTLEIYHYGDTSEEWGRGLGKGLARNTSLKSLTLQIYAHGDTSKKWGRGLGEGLAQNTSLESLSMKINNCAIVSNESEHGLGEGLARNTSLKSLVLEIKNRVNTSKEWGCGFGEGLARNTSLKSLRLEIENYGDTSKEWGRGLGEGLARNTSLKSLTLQINHHGNTSKEWGHGLGDGLARNNSLNSLTLKMKNYDYENNCAWILGLVRGLATNASLKSLTLAINNHGDTSNGWGHVLGESLAKNISLNSLTLTIDNYSYMSDKWGVRFAEGLARNTSLKSITLTMNNYFYMSSVWGLRVIEGSARNMSLKSITLAINNYGCMTGERGHDIVEGLARNASLNSITLTINNYGDMKGEWGHCLLEGLARNTSLNSLTLTISNYCHMSDVWGLGLAEGLARNTSLNSLTLAANNYYYMSEEWVCALREGFTKSKSLTECNLIVNVCGKC